MKRKLISAILALATLVSLIAGVSVTAQAATEYSSGTPVLKYGNAMYFIQEGRVNFNFSGTVTTAAGDFTVKNGVVV